MSVLLPLPLTPVTTVMMPSGILIVDVLQIALQRAGHGEPLAGESAADLSRSSMVSAPDRDSAR